MNILFNLKKYNYQICLLGIIISSFVLYFNTLNGSLLNWDDTTYLLDNKLMNQALSFDSFQNIYQAEHHISLVLSSFLIQIRLFGNDVFGMHLFNLLFHLANIVLVYFVSLKLLKNKLYALFIALLFSIHPMRSETVGWIMQRKDILFTFFFLLSSISFLEFLKHKKIGYFILVIAFGLVSSLCKIQAIALPFVLILLELYQNKKITTLSLAFFVPLILLQNNILFSFWDIIMFALIPSFISVYWSKINRFKIPLIPKFILGKFKKHASLLTISNLIVTLYFLTFLFSFSVKNSFINGASSRYLVSFGIFYLLAYHPNIKSSKKYFLLILLFAFGLIGAYYLFTSKLSVSLTEKIAYSTSVRLHFATYSLSYYFFKFFAPFNLSAMHPYPDNPNANFSLLYDFSYFFIIGFLGLIGVLLYRMKNIILRNQILFGILFFLINIFLVLHIIPIQGRVIVADRYTYLAYFGLFFAVVPIIGNIMHKLANNNIKKYIFIGFLSIILLSFTTQTWMRNKVWQNDEAFWTDIVNKDTRNHYANFSLALYYYEKKDFTKALEYYNKAIQKNGKDFEYYTNRGSCYVKLGETTKAIDDFAKAIDLNPKNAYAYNNRGVLFQKIGDINNAVIDYQIACQIDSNYTEATNNLQKAKIIQSAIETSTNTNDYNPKKSQIFNDLGVKTAMNGDFENSILDFTKAILFDSLNIDAYKNRGNAYASIKKFEEAMFDYNNVLKHLPNDAGIYMNIGNIKHQMNDKSACEYWQKAKSLGLMDAQKMISKFCN